MLSMKQKLIKVTEDFGNYNQYRTTAEIAMHTQDCEMTTTKRLTEKAILLHAEAAPLCQHLSIWNTSLVYCIISQLRD